MQLISYGGDVRIRVESEISGCLLMRICIISLRKTDLSRDSQSTINCSSNE